MENRNEEWQQKLLGKQLLKDGDTTAADNQETVKVQDLPQGHRILPPGALQTRDYRPERLNVFVDENYKINQVYFG